MRKMIVGKINSGRMTLLALVVGFVLSFTVGKPLSNKLDPATMPEDFRNDVQKIWCNDTIFPNKKQCDEIKELGVDSEACFGVEMKVEFILRKNGNNSLNVYDSKKLGKMMLKMKCDSSDEVTHVHKEVGSTTKKAKLVGAVTSNFISILGKHSGNSISPKDNDTSTSTPANKANSGEGLENLTPTTGDGDDNSALVWIISLVVLLLLGMALIGIFVHLRVKKSGGYLRSSPVKPNVVHPNGHYE